ncbi:MAG: 16S rRNA (uracil(1498)-N(3))-methyltransferase [Pseudomonadota bacterium]
MRISRLYTDQPLAPETELVLDERRGHYLQRVLRLRPGDTLVLFNGDGNDYAVEFLGGPKAAPRVRVNARLPAVPESPLQLVLAQAVGKGDRMDQVLQKATELGVAGVQPLFTERTEVRLSGSRLARRMDHWRAVTIAACEQSGRARLPDLHPPLDLDSWLATPGDALRLALVPGAERPLTAVAPVPEMALLIGPEGGLSEREVAALTLSGCVPVAFGPRILRTETAGPAAVAVLQAMAGDCTAA